MDQGNANVPDLTIGIDVGDKHSRVCALAATGEIVEEARIRTTADAFRRRFGGTERARIVLEVGAHSPWLARLLEELGQEVICANPRKLRLIYENDRKDDRVDAEYLARVGRLDPKLLAPIQHRKAETQADLALLRSRDALVRTRTKLVNHVRGAVKATGSRLPRCSTRSFHNKAAEALPEVLADALAPLLEIIGDLTTRIRRMDKQIEQCCAERYPETEFLRQVHGVGSLTALCYRLTLEDPDRFKKSRDVGAYVGLVPRRDASGDSDPQLRITKTGDVMLRRLLVQSAHYILGPFGPDTDLRRFGERIAARGGGNAKKRAVVAVARKLAVLLHRLWITGEVYEPLYHSGRNATSEAAGAKNAAHGATEDEVEATEAAAHAAA